MTASAETAADDWAASGAMALTGHADGPPLLARGAAATVVRATLERLGLPIGSTILGERAALAGTSRQAPRSLGGAFRILRAADGWLGISLPRSDDLASVPALVEATVDDPWDAVARWAERTPAGKAADRCQLLGLACTVVPTVLEPPRRVGITTRDGGPRDRRDRPPLVVDLSSLWAGPLCAHLLGLLGCDVVKVESSTRPDGARRGETRFFDLLHYGHRSVALDFATETGRGSLRHLIDIADVVIEASRPRALAALGVDAERVVDRGGVWVGITAYGRDPQNGHRIGFGDDVAAGAGLVAFDDTGMPVPAGDALADPLTGVTAAAAAADALASDAGRLIDVSMHDVARAAAGLPSASDTTVAVASPVARPVMGRAPRLGQHTAAVLAAFGAA